MNIEYKETCCRGHTNNDKCFVPFPYTGSKCWLLKILKKKIEYFIDTKEIDTIVDLFGGAGTFILNIKPARKIQRVYNDIDKGLYCFFKVMTTPEEREKFIDLITYSFPHQDIYQEFKKELNTQNLSELFTAFYYFYVKCCSLSVREFYAPTQFKRYEATKLKRYKNRIFEMLQSKDFLDILNNLLVYNLDYKILLKKVARANSLIFVDPPYLKEGIQLYKHGEFGIEDHKILKDMILQGGGYYILTETNPILKEIWGPPTIEVIKLISTNYIKDNPRRIKKEYIWTNIKEIEPQTINLTKKQELIEKICDNERGGITEDG